MVSDEQVFLELAQLAYNAYGDDADWTTWNGGYMPIWDNLGVEVQSHWIAAVTKIVAVINKNVTLLNVLHSGST